MVFKSSSVALFISSILACQVQASEQPSTDMLSVVGSHQHSAKSQSDGFTSFTRINELKGIYILQLSEKSALDQSYASLGNKRTAVVSKVDAQQGRVIAAIKSLDNEAVIAQKVRLVDNALQVQMSHAAADALKDNADIVSIVETMAQPSLTQDDEFKPYPFLKINDPGDNVTVAIIGNGVDYTHKDLGGVGTPEAYAQAWKNNRNAWDGFPTNTVIGGLDFSAIYEWYHTVDYNPIENQDDEVATDHNYHYPSGTAQAALVLKQAPNAKILAYKTLDYDWNFFYAALDVVVDPNQDGDFSDRPDIVLINSFGGGAFYQKKGSGASYETLQIDHMRRLAGLGSLIVAPAGTFYLDSYYSMAPLGATPEALTVGAVRMDKDALYLSSFTPAGPTRGDTLLKPDVVALAEGFDGALAGTGDKSGELARTTAYAAANAAGIAARVWQREPNLSALEVKALVANTANAEGISGLKETVVEQGFSVDVTKVPEVPFMGTGMVNASNIDKAKAVLWETGSYQPSLAFGFIEAASTVSQTRDVTLKNLTAEPQTYRLAAVKNGVKDNNAAVELIFPETVSVPANSAITFPVTLTVNDKLLSPFPMSKSRDYTIEKWAEASVNGYLTFTNENSAAEDALLKMAWLVLPRKATPFEKSNATLSGSLSYQSDEFKQKLNSSGSYAESSKVDITNSTNSDRTLVTMPLMHYKSHRSDAKRNLQGHIIKSLGATIYNIDTQQCASGKALGVSIEMFDPFELAMAEHRDRFSVLSHFRIYSETFADANGDDPTYAEQIAQDADKLAYMMIELDDNGKPVTTYVDMSVPYDPWNPYARYKQSSLDTFVSPGGKIAIANICMDALYREQYPDLASWNKKLGWQFGTDRDAVSASDEQMLRFNPVLNGDYSEQVIDHTGEDGYPNWWDFNCQATQWNPNNCIEKSVKFLASSSASALLPDDIAPKAVVEKDLIWSPITTIPAGKTARVAAAMTNQCDPNVISSGNWVVDKACPPGVAIFELVNNQIAKFPTTVSDDVTALDGQSFSVYENAANGSVVGKIKTVSPRFFASDALNQAEMFLMNALPGTPFAVSTTGEITVINSAALDYESLNKSYVLEVQVDHINRASELINVTVDVTNNNDVAPSQIASLPVIQGAMGNDLSANIAKAFIDVEGDGVSFISSELPDGLTISRSGEISGVPATAGEFTSSITVTDGVNQVQASINFSIASSNSSAPAETPISGEPTQAVPSDTGTSGGGFSFLMSLVAALSLVARRTRQ
ncbi:S8 family serine peptidase [Shewanella seohaensis]|uniref:S8 family serine peptidase n=1 Tax=Shewanella seohaensis TaxID=755175 RepID=A0ABV4VZ50_9GAMM